MKHKSSGVLLCLVALSALALFVTPGVAADLPANDLVTLRGDLVFVGDFGGTTTFTRILKDGKTTSNYSIPNKKVLVITDVEWVVGADIVKNVQFSLIFKNQEVYAAAMNLQGPPGPGDLFHGKYWDRLNSGFAMNNMSNNNFKAQATASSQTSTSVRVFLRGYLAANK